MFDDEQVNPDAADGLDAAEAASQTQEPAADPTPEDEGEVTVGRGPFDPAPVEGEVETDG